MKPYRPTPAPATPASATPATPTRRAVAAGLPAFVAAWVLMPHRSPAAVTSPGQSLIDAASRGDLAGVEKLLASGAPVTERDGRGRTALLAATHANHVEVARRLIAAGADVNAKDDIHDSPYLYAAAEGRLEILKMTLAAGADLRSVNRYGGTGLIPAAHHGHVEVVRTLLPDRDGVTPLAHARRMGQSSVVAILTAAGAR